MIKLKYKNQNRKKKKNQNIKIKVHLCLYCFIENCKTKMHFWKKSQIQTMMTET